MSTPNGFDQHWVDAINGVMEDRGSEVRIKDINGDLWDLFIGPLCNAVEDGVDNVSPVELLDRAIYEVAPPELQKV